MFRVLTRPRVSRFNQVPRYRENPHGRRTGEYPSKERMKDSYGWDLKERLHLRWNILNGFLHKRLNKPWSEIWSEACSVFRNGKTQTALDDLKCAVGLSGWSRVIVIDGVPYQVTRGEVEFRHWRSMFYVDPITGLLKLLPWGLGRRENISSLPDAISLDRDGVFLVRCWRFWYRCTVSSTLNQEKAVFRDEFFGWTFSLDGSENDATPGCVLNALEKVWGEPFLYCSECVPATKQDLRSIKR